MAGATVFLRGSITAAASAAALSLLAGGAGATPPPPPDITLQGYVSGAWLTSPGTIPNWQAAGLSGQGTVWLAPMWSAQFDATIAGTWRYRPEPDGLILQRSTIVGAG